MPKEDTYGTGAVITGGLTFVAIWIYAMASWGFLLGLMLGWIPAIIGAIIGAALWPIVAVVFGILVLLILSQL